MIPPGSKHSRDAVGYGASIYDVRNVWGEEGPQKADKRNQIS